MISILLLAGFLYSTQGAEVSDFEDLFSALTNNNNNKYTVTSNNQAKKNTKLANGHEPFEMTFPLFYDIFPMAGLEGRMKDSVKVYQEDKDSIQENNGQKVFSKLFKHKKKPKDKVVVSFSEFFIPFTNHKTSFDTSGLPMKFNFFEDFLKDFPFKDFEEPLLKHRLQGKLLGNKNKTKLQEHYFDRTSISSTTTKKGDNMDKIDFLFQKPKETEIFLFQNGNENLENGAEKQIETRVSNGCCGHPECKMNEHCLHDMCTDRPSNEDIFIPKNGKDMYTVLEAANLDKLTKVALLYTVPILIGIGGIIIGFEILRKHKHIVRAKQIPKDYDPLQRC